MRTLVNKESNFEKKYFTEQFTAVGNFSRNDLKRNVNWFLSQLNFFEKKFNLHFKNKKSILEIGCAIGGIAHIFSTKECSVHAIDISKYVIARSKSLSPKVKFYVGDIQKKIPISKKFDYIFAFEVLEHLKDPYKGIVNIKKILNKNGILIITTPYPFGKYINMNTHENVMHPSKWIILLKKSGFRNIKYKPVTFVPFLYRIHPKLGIIIPFNSNLPFINSTVFYVAKI